MTFIPTYPPNSPESQRLLFFTNPAETPPAQTAPALAPNASSSTPPPPDRRQHWLAYDPSARSQYPLD